ncbi:MAG: hypothetical protein HFG33_00630 [Bacilli bacterium]|nr:hypothetical protein [Bacilli bacterium]
MNEKRKKIVILTVCAVTLMLASILGTYAYFVSSINNDNRQEAEVDTGTMRLRFADNDEGINAKLMLGESITKKFTLENTGTLDATVSIEWLDMINTYTEESLTYTLSYAETEDGEYTEIVSSTNVPTSSTAFTSTLVPDITLQVGKTYYYNLIITLNNLNDVDQSEDLNASFSTKFVVSQPSTNRKYTLTIDPNGGTIGGSSEIQTFSMNVGDTYELGTNDTTGYKKFEGWTISGYDSSIEDSTITMGKSNVKVVAKYGSFKIQEAINTISAGETPKYVNTIVPNFSNPATTDEGVFAMEDDYGTSYYYRGAVENNYVKFGDFYWRIIRINGDRSVRIIYDGTKLYKNGENDDDRFIHSTTPYNKISNDNKYNGWMFGGAQGEPSTSKVQAQTNETDSDAKKLVDAWYKENIEDKNLGDKVSDTLFCNDRTTPGKDATGLRTDTGLGYLNNKTAYGASSRVNVWNTDPSKVQPIFTCPQKNNAFTVSDEVKGNANLTYPVGLITADEIVAAGSGKFATQNSNYYLYKGSCYWSFSPLQFNDDSASQFVVGSGGALHNDPVQISNAFAPVINLKPEYIKTMIGDGTINNPYREVIK